jgi:hypothetical protein
VVHVEVDDRNPLEPELLLRRPCRDRDVVDTQNPIARSARA